MPENLFQRLLSRLMQGALDTELWTLIVAVHPHLTLHMQWTLYY